MFSFSIGIVPVLAEQIFKDIDAKKNAGIEFEVRMGTPRIILWNFLYEIDLCERVVKNW